MNVGAAGARPATGVSISASSPAYQAYQILHWGFVLAPLVAGLDKFFNFLVDWSQYLAPRIAQMLPLTPQLFMRAMGVVEIIAALIVAFKPRIGGYIVALWLWAIIVNLLLYPGW